MPASKIEFAVQMKGKNASDSIRNILEVYGPVEIDESSGRLTINTNVPWIDIQQKIEESGRKAVLSGFGDHSAVAIVKGDLDKIKGVVRFSSISDSENGIVVDGVIDGLRPGQHGLHIHECGDITNGCNSLGSHYNPRNTRHGSPENDENDRHAGDLGNIESNEIGQAKFRFIDKFLKVSELIGRSIAVTDNPDDFGLGSDEQSQIDGNSGERLACGIIARSAGIFQNFKRICACDGVTIWDERDKPLVGAARRDNKSKI